MVIIMMLSNNRGVSLIVLIVAMTLIAILGTSFVSLMSSKQKGFLYQIDSYRALNIANAGVEYAIRYTSDGLDGSSNSIFFSDSALATIGKSFGGGSFSVNYVYATNTLSVTGTYGSNSSRQIKLTNFRRYISPITLVPDGATLPSKNSTQVIIPVINNNESASVTVSQLNLTINASGKHLQQILISTQVPALFDFNTPGAFPSCGAPPCKDTLGILLPSGSAVLFNATYGLANHQINRDDIVNYTLVFYETAPSGQYTIKPSTDSPAVESIIIFTLP
jgi:hypothetical protein